jgi:hypothetical protein
VTLAYLEFNRYPQASAKNVPNVCLDLAANRRRMSAEGLRLTVIAMPAVAMFSFVYILEDQTAFPI